MRNGHDFGSVLLGLVVVLSVITYGNGTNGGGSRRTLIATLVLLVAIVGVVIEVWAVHRGSVAGCRTLMSLLVVAREPFRWSIRVRCRVRGGTV